MHWIFGAILAVINISVFCVWIPARLQISPTHVFVNDIWDRVEKVIFCIIDAGCNLYFIYLIRSRLIANGMTKYNIIYRINLGLIAVSISLDVSGLARSGTTRVAKFANAF